MRVTDTNTDYADVLNGWTRAHVIEKPTDETGNDNQDDKETTFHITREQDYQRACTKTTNQYT